MIEQIENTFTKLKEKIETLRIKVESSDFYDQVGLVDSTIVTNDFNNIRNDMLNKIRKKRDFELDRLKDNTTKPDEIKYDRIYFLAGTQSLLECGLAGNVRIECDILSRIQFLKLRPHSKTIRLPRLETSNLSYYRQQSINFDLLLPYSPEKIFYAYSSSLEATSNSYNLQIKNFSKNRDYLFKSENVIGKGIKLELCQIDYELNRVIVFFENSYQKDYELKFYDLVSLNLIRSVTMNHSLQRLLCFKNEILLHYWNEDYMTNIKFHKTHNFQPINHKVEFDNDIFVRFYSIDDFNESFLLVHSQKEIGIICRETGQLQRQKNIEDCLDANDNVRDSHYLLENNHNQFEERAKI